MSLTWGNSLALKTAQLCVTCDAITEAPKGEYCPVCAGRANWLPIGRLLGSTREKSDDEKVKGAAA